MPTTRRIFDFSDSANERSDIYEKLAVAEREIAEGAQGKDFLAVVREMRTGIHGMEL